MPEVDLNDFAPGSENTTDPSTPNECNEEEIEVNTTEMKDKSDCLEKDGKEEEEWADILGNGQLRMKVLVKGEQGTRPHSSDMCTLQITGTLDNGNIVEKHEELTIQLGDYEVVQGLELVIPLMDTGDTVEVEVAPRFAYGSIGNPPDIPPNANIKYIVKLLKVEEEPDLQKVPYEKRKELANLKRERGNWWYLRQDATKAVQCYRKALNILNEEFPINDDDNKTETNDDILKDIIKQKLKVYNNLAAAQLMMEAYDSALSSVNQVIRYDPNNVKALFRKSKILTAKDCVNEAVETLRKAFMLEPENTAVKMELSRCVKLQQIEKQHEKNLYKKMLGRDTKDTKNKERTKARCYLWNKVVGTAVTATLMAAVAVAISYKFKNYLTL